MNKNQRLLSLVERVTGILRSSERVYLSVIASSNNLSREIELPPFRHTRSLREKNNDIEIANKLSYKVNELIDKISQPTVLVGNKYIYKPDIEKTIRIYARFDGAVVTVLRINDDASTRSFFNKEASDPNDKDKCIYLIIPDNDRAYQFYVRPESLVPITTKQNNDNPPIILDKNVNDIKLKRYTRYKYTPNIKNTKPPYFKHKGAIVELISLGGTEGNGFPGDGVGDVSDCIYLVVMSKNDMTFRTRKESLTEI